jgi:hypothetical protein
MNKTKSNPPAKLHSPSTGHGTGEINITQLSGIDSVGVHSQTIERIVRQLTHKAPSSSLNVPASIEDKGGYGVPRDKALYPLQFKFAKEKR